MSTHGDSTECQRKSIDNIRIRELYNYKQLKSHK